VIFFQLFTERWTMACQGLTAAQEGMYLRLVVWTYANECPLPLDREECCRIARVSAVSADDFADVGFLLKKFFMRTPSGYEQKKAVAEIDRFQAGEPARAARREADAKRKRAGREEQRKLYGLARERGLKTGPHMSNAELRALLGIPEPTTNVVHLSAGLSAADASAMSADSLQVTDGNVAHAHNPLPITHNVLRRTDSADSPLDADGAALSARLDGGPLEVVPKAEPVSDERLRSAVQALRDGGLVGINSGHPMFLELLRAGISDEALLFAAASAAAKGKPFAYAIAVAEGQMRDAAAASLPSAKARAAASIVAQIAPGLEAKW
jgi:uncharacterized protein YdaU (DUF1376 family)